jgi:hypothetical protein
MSNGFEHGCDWIQENTKTTAPIFHIGKYKITSNEHGVWFTRDDGESMQVKEEDFDKFWKDYF